MARDFRHIWDRNVLCSHDWFPWQRHQHHNPPLSSAPQKNNHTTYAKPSSLGYSDHCAGISSDVPHAHVGTWGVCGPHLPMAPLVWHPLLLLLQWVVLCITCSNSPYVAPISNQETWTFSWLPRGYPGYWPISRPWLVGAGPCPARQVSAAPPNGLLLILGPYPTLFSWCVLAFLRRCLWSGTTITWSIGNKSF